MILLQIGFSHLTFYSLFTPVDFHSVQAELDL